MQQPSRHGVTITFGQSIPTQFHLAAPQFKIKAHRPSWKNAKHAAQWQATLSTYADPVIGAVPVEMIDTSLLLKVQGAPGWLMRIAFSSSLTDPNDKGGCALDALRDIAKLVGRIFIAALFLYDAILLARFPTTTIAYMEQFGVSGVLLWPTAVFELAGSLMIIAGLLTRLTAVGFAGFCVLTAVLFHHDFADGNEVIQFGKDFGLSGGFLFLLVGGAGRWSLDAWFGTDSWPIPNRRALKG